MAVAGACSASRTLCTAVATKRPQITTHARFGRKRSATSPPTSAPIPSPVTMTAQAAAPPSDWRAMYGPRTKNGAYVTRK